MSLTEIQKRQIRYMVSCNPTTDNMERIAALSDIDVLAELEGFKIHTIPLLQQQLTDINEEYSNNISHLNSIDNLIQLLQN